MKLYPHTRKNIFSLLLLSAIGIVAWSQVIVSTSTPTITQVRRLRQIQINFPQTTNGTISLTGYFAQAQYNGTNFVQESTGVTLTLSGTNLDDAITASGLPITQNQIKNLFLKLMMVGWTNAAYSDLP